MSIKLLHTADLHLGHSRFANIHPETGGNHRQQDVLDRFADLIQTALDEGIDAMVISGDFFDSIRPGYNVISYAIRQLMRLEVPVYIIGGNHDTPKRANTISPLQVLSYLPNVYMTYTEPMTCKKPDYTVHMIPYCPDHAELLSKLQLAKDATKPGVFDILMLHQSYGDFRGALHDEAIITNDEMSGLEDYFSYIAMGHLHASYQNGNKVAYSGSLSRLSFNEVDDMKGFFIVDDRGGMTHHGSDCRELLDLEPLIYNSIDTSGRVTEGIVEYINSHDIDDKICRLTVVDIPALVYRSLDYRELRSATDKAFNFSFKFDIKEEKLNYIVEKITFKAMADEWNDFIDNRGVGDDLREIGLTYLKEL